MRHKHADIIHAWAEGAEIEIKCPNGAWMYIKRPEFDVFSEYRIKPKEPEWWENIPKHGVLVRSNHDGSITVIFNADIPLNVSAQDWTPLTNDQIERFKR